LLPGQLVLQEQRQPGQRVTFPVRLAARRQAVASARSVVRERRAVVALEHRAGQVHLPRAVPVVVAAVARAAAAAEQTRSIR